MYMAMKHLETICSKLIEGGRKADEPVAIVTRASLDGQRVVETTLVRAATDASDAGLEPPAVVCVGDMVRLHAGLDWLGALQGRELVCDPLGHGKDASGISPAERSKAG